MQLAVRYRSTPGGRVAYSVAGAGPALLIDPGWITDLRAQLGLWSFGAFVERLTQHFTVIRYDRLGCGLSDRDGVDLSFDAQLAAAVAVLDAVHADRVSVFGASQGGHLATALAARSPDRVDALALYGTCADGRDLAPADVRSSVVALVRAHWGLGFKALAGAFVTDPSAEDLATFAAMQRAAASASTAADLLQLYYDTDLTALLPSVRARTMVLHREADQGTPFALGRQLAAQLPDAVLVPLPGTSHLFYHGDWQSVADAVIDFVGSPTDAAEPQLTPRELEVAVLVAQGMTNQAVARRLGVAPRTADAHVENIRRKLEVRSRAQIAAWVTERRLH